MSSKEEKRGWFCQRRRWGDISSLCSYINKIISSDHLQRALIAPKGIQRYRNELKGFKWTKINCNGPKSSVQRDRNGTNGQKWTETDGKEPKCRKGLTRTKMDQVFLKKKNMSPIRFAPLYIFDTKNEIIKIINYIHVIKKLVVVISKLLTL